METLQRNMDELQDSFESAVRMSETKTRQHLENILAEQSTVLDAKDAVIADLQQKLGLTQLEGELQRVKFSAVDRVQSTNVGEFSAVKEAESETEVITATPVRSSRPPATPSAAAQNAAKLEFMSPSQLRSSVKFRAVATPGSIAKRYLEGTPGARPVQWVVEQANTEVKRLRERAEQIARGDAGAAAAVTAAAAVGLSTAVECGEGQEGSAGTNALWRMKINAMKLHLSEAMAVIQEQDRLIHSGKNFACRLHFD